MNIFEMYCANQNKAGFFVQRNSWSGTVAKIKSIGDQECGELIGIGNHPYYNKAREWVYAELFLIKGNQLIQVEPTFNHVGNTKMFFISCPGTYAYSTFDSSKYEIIKI